MPFDWKAQDSKSITRHAGIDSALATVPIGPQRRLPAIPPPVWDAEVIDDVFPRERASQQNFAAEGWVTPHCEAPAPAPAPAPPAREKHAKFGILDAPSLLARDLAQADGVLGCTVLSLDADYFKSFNARYTERVVDRELLPELHRLIEAMSRGFGHAYAEGGDDMVVLLPNCNEALGITLAETMRSTVVGHAFPIAGGTVRLSLSIGVASTPLIERGALAERADLARDEAKRGGRNRVFVARPEGFLPACVRPIVSVGTPIDGTGTGVRPWRGAFR